MCACRLALPYVGEAWGRRECRTIWRTILAQCTWIPNNFTHRIPLRLNRLSDRWLLLHSISVYVTRQCCFFEFNSSSAAQLHREHWNMWSQHSAAMAHIDNIIDRTAANGHGPVACFRENRISINHLWVVSFSSSLYSLNCSQFANHNIIMFL